MEATHPTPFPLLPRASTRDEVSLRIGAGWEELLFTVRLDGLRDIVIVSGSLIEGLGNEFSDIDLFIIGPRGALLDVFFWHKVRRWLDVSHLAWEDVSRALDDVGRNGGRPPADWSSGGPRLSTLDLYHRLWVGVTLTDATLEKKRGAPLDGKLLGRELAFVQIAFARSAWLDAAGALRSGHYGQCVYGSEIAYGHAVDAYTALLGETNPGTKWRWARVARLAEDPLHVSVVRPLFATTDLFGAQRALIAVAALLFQVQIFCLTGSFVEYEHDLLPFERYEPTGSEVLRFTASGAASRSNRTFRPISIRAGDPPQS